MTNNPTPTQRQRRHRRIVVVALVIAATLAVLMSSAPIAAAETTNNSSLDDVAPYYTDESSDVSSDGWFDGVRDPGLHNMSGMAARLGPYVIGWGDVIPGGGGYAGTVILGLVVLGIFTGMVAGTSIGTSGAGVVALTAAYGLIEVGLAPPWLKIVVLFLIGIVAAVVVIRTSS